METMGDWTKGGWHGGRSSFLIRNVLALTHVNRCSSARQNRVWSRGKSLMICAPISKCAVILGVSRVLSAYRFLPRSNDRQIRKFLLSNFPCWGKLDLPNSTAVQEPAGRARRGSGTMSRSGTNSHARNLDPEPLTDSSRVDRGGRDDGQQSRLW